MVDSTSAREDVDNILLTKTVTYYKYDTTNKDLAYKVQTRGTPTSYSIKAQCTVQTLDSKYVQEGIVQAGDLVGLFRYEYTLAADGTTAISPTLVPKKGDEILFLSLRFVVKACTPATSEDSEIIGFDFTAGVTKTP